MTSAPMPDAPPLWPLGTTPLPGARRVIATVPGAEAPVIALTLPPTLRGAARMQVARRQVQDRLGMDALALWPVMTGPDWTHAVVVAPDRLRAWRTQAVALGKACAAILPDYLALPSAPDLWVLHHADGMVSARLGQGDGFSAETDLAGAMLARVPVPPRAVWLLGDALPDDLLPPGVPVVRDPADLPDGVRPVPALGPVLGVDLAGDPASDGAAGLARMLRGAMVPVALAVAAAASFSAAMVIETRRDHAAAEAMRSAVTEAARADILPAGPIIDLRAQVLRAVDARRAAAGPGGAETALSVLRRASEGLAMLTVSRVSMTDAPGVTARVQAPDFATLEDAMALWAEAGLGAETLQSSTSGNGGVIAEIRLSGGQP